MEKSHCTPSMLLSKPFVSGRKKAPFEGTITSKLESQLEEYTCTLATTFEDEINKSENLVKSDLNDLMAGFEKSCDVLEEVEKSLQSSITEDCFELDIGNSDANNGQISLRKRMEEYHEEVESKSQSLTDLWNQWATIQCKIICLAVGTLSHDVLEDDELVSSEFVTSINNAQVPFEEGVRRTNEHHAKLLQIQTEIETISTRSIKESKQQLKEVQIARRKDLKAIGNALHNLGSH